MRIYYLRQFTKAVDVTWLMGPVFIWSTIEPSVAMVCACLPHLAPLVRLARQTIFTSLKSQRSKTGNSSGPHRSLGPSGQDSQGKVTFGSRGAKFDYGFAQMKRDANDDEIGLTNYVRTHQDHGKHSSLESISGEDDRHHAITVQSSFVQAVTPRSPR